MPIFVAVWIIFSINFIVVAIENLRIIHQRSLNLTLEEKLTRIDRDFYQFMQFCQEKIPPGSKAVFFAQLSEYNNIYKDKGEFFLRQHTEKAAYYLYPTIVYPKIELLNDKVDYIIVYNGDIVRDEFREMAQYDKNKYILRRE